MCFYQFYKKVIKVIEQKLKVFSPCQIYKTVDF
jgi:hypothetical protein